MRALVVLAFAVCLTVAGVSLIAADRANDRAAALEAVVEEQTQELDSTQRAFATSRAAHAADLEETIAVLDSMLENDADIIGLLVSTRKRLAVVENG